MKFLYILIFLISGGIFSQQIDYNTQKGFVAEGYDVVEYFNNNAEKGDKKFTAEFDGVKFKFSSEENLALFNKNPKKYIPQYWGYCAYAVGAKNIKKATDPESFEIRDGKLYLFYTSFFGDKIEDWQEGDTKKLQQKADKNWQNLKDKNN